MTVGSSGINLQGATNMFVMDLNWNPQKEVQIMKRIHRIGQTKPVTIFKFVCDDTIEETILKIQEKKITIAENALKGNKTGLNNLTIVEMRALFRTDAITEEPEDSDDSTILGGNVDLTIDSD